MNEDERATLLSRISFRETCRFKSEQNKVTLFAGTRCNSYVHVGIRLHGKAQGKCLIDTGADPKVVNECFFRSTCSSRTKRQNILKLECVNKQAVRSEEMIPLHQQIGGLCIRVWFGAVNNLALHLLVRKIFHQ